MSSNGNDIAFQVSNAGVTCGNVGYVEEKGSDSKGDTCATETSHWVLSYNGSSGYSGSTSVEMAADMTHNTASLSKSTPGTVICASGAPCISTSQAWPQGSQGPLFLVFQPPNAPPQ